MILLSTSWVCVLQQNYLLFYSRKSRVYYDQDHFSEWTLQNNYLLLVFLHYKLSGNVDYFLSWRYFSIILKKWLHFRAVISLCYTVSLCLPLRRLACNTLRPFDVLILFLNPWTLFLCLSLGWYVIHINFSSFNIYLVYGNVHTGKSISLIKTQPLLYRKSIHIVKDYRSIIDQSFLSTQKKHYLIVINNKMLIML